MKVSTDAVNTTAVIGNLEVQTMKIDDSPEFFNILSSTLYTHQEMAFVREGISNAQDAHTDAGVTDPIEITIDSSYYTIKDKGKGIPHDKIADIYIVYGRGTKRDNANAIGGFGLGSKSPHAYCDSFIVISCNGGVRTTYTMNKGGTISHNKSAMITMSSVPTDETGITVMIPIASPYDVYNLTNMTSSFISNGDIHATLNGKEVPKLNMSMEEGSLALLSESHRGNNVPSRLGAMPTVVGMMNIRIANVIYPLPAENSGFPEYTANRKMLTSLLTSINRQRSNDLPSINFVVIQAAPNEISIQPSREGVAMTTSTMTYLTGLIEKVYDVALESFSKGRDDYLAYHGNPNNIAKVKYKTEFGGYAITIAKMPSLALLDNSPSSLFYKLGTECRGVTNLTGMAVLKLAKRAMEMMYHEMLFDSGTLSKMVSLYKCIAVAQKKDPTRSILSLRELNYQYITGVADYAIDWKASSLQLEPYINYQITKKIQKYVSADSYKLMCSYTYGSIAKVTSVSARYTDLKPPYYHSTLQWGLLNLPFYFNPLIVIHKNGKTLQDRIERELLKHTVAHGVRIIVAMRAPVTTKVGLEELREYVSTQKVPWMDLTVRIDGDPDPVVRVKSVATTQIKVRGAAALAPTSEGFLRADCLINASDEFSSGTLYNSSFEAKYVKNPDLVLLVSLAEKAPMYQLRRDNGSYVRHITAPESTALVTRYGKRIGLVNSTVQLQKAVDCRFTDSRQMLLELAYKAAIEEHRASVKSHKDAVYYSEGLLRRGISEVLDSKENRSLSITHRQSSRAVVTHLYEKHLSQLPKYKKITMKKGKHVRHFSWVMEYANHDMITPEMATFYHSLRQPTVPTKLIEVLHNLLNYEDLQWLSDVSLLDTYPTHPIAKLFLSKIRKM